MRSTTNGGAWATVTDVVTTKLNWIEATRLTIAPVGIRRVKFSVESGLHVDVAFWRVRLTSGQVATVFQQFLKRRRTYFIRQHRQAIYTPTVRYLAQPT